MVPAPSVFFQLPVFAEWITGISNFAFADPLWLCALGLIPSVVWLRRRRSVPVLLVPFAAAWHSRATFSPSRWPIGLTVTALVFIILALARPQRIEDKREVRAEGYDIMLAIDVSGSMLAEDYKKGDERINRLEAIKPVIQAFITQRPNDRIGIVVFSGRAYTLAPLTFDHDWLAQQIERIKIGLIEDGTAIGDGLGVALSRLEQAARQQDGRRLGAFAILLTDGSNNHGSLEPMQAAAIAKGRSIPVYTIGAGREGIVPFPVFDQSGKKVGYQRMQSDLDQKTLVEIAKLTGGQAYRADDEKAIESAFKQIDRSQKIEFQAKSYLLTTELFPWFATPGIALLLIAAIASAIPRRATPNSPAHISPRVSP